MQVVGMEGPGDSGNDGQTLATRHVAELFSVTKLAAVPTIPQQNKHLKLESPKTSDSQKLPLQAR
jgi:hypothetical protein